MLPVVCITGTARKRQRAFVFDNSTDDLPLLADVIDTTRHVPVVRTSTQIPPPTSDQNNPQRRRRRPRLLLLSMDDGTTITTTTTATALTSPDGNDDDSNPSFARQRPLQISASPDDDEVSSLPQRRWRRGPPGDCGTIRGRRTNFDL